VPASARVDRDVRRYATLASGIDDAGERFSRFGLGYDGSTFGALGRHEWKAGERYGEGAVIVPQA